MEHKGTKRLETDRLILRRYTESDADLMYKNWPRTRRCPSI